MKKLKVACSPLTNAIYVGQVNDKKGLWVGDKQDVTMDCLIATIEHALKFGAPIEIATPSGDVEFEITVKDLRNYNNDEDEEELERILELENETTPLAPGAEDI